MSEVPKNTRPKENTCDAGRRSADSHMDYPKYERRWAVGEHDTVI